MNKATVSVRQISVGNWLKVPIDIFDDAIAQGGFDKFLQLGIECINVDDDLDAECAVKVLEIVLEHLE